MAEPDGVELFAAEQRTAGAAAAAVGDQLLWCGVGFLNAVGVVVGDGGMLTGELARDRGAARLVGHGAVELVRDLGGHPTPAELRRGALGGAALGRQIVGAPAIRDARCAARSCRGGRRRVLGRSDHLIGVDLSTYPGRQDGLDLGWIEALGAVDAGLPVVMEQERTLSAITASSGAA